MSYTQGGMFRGITWLVLVVFYLQMLNPVMLGYAPWQGPPPPHSEESARSFWQGLLDVVIRPAQAAEASPTLRSSVVFTQRDYVPAYAQPKADGDPLLASTPEFDLTDPYLVEKATELGNDPQRIFAFVRDSIGFESYVGSLRGARGALWSNAGNALDQASLLIALLRISGIPARYAQGTLAKDKAQELIASMFLPAPYRVVGFVPDNAEKSDPVNDPALIAEAQQHFWVEFQQGGGFVAADPAFRSAQLGQTFTAASGQFAEVPDNLRHKVAVRLQAETGGNALDPELRRKTVLDQTFTSAELVGKPLSIGHFVSSSAQGGIIGVNYTHTYSPYLLVGQNDGDISDDPIIRGQDYQEFISSIFGSLANSVVTGVFLEMDVIQPGGQKETFERALVDRIGFAARNSSAGADLNLDLSSGQPAIFLTDIATINIGIGPLKEGTIDISVSDSELQAIAKKFDDLKAQIDKLSPDIDQKLQQEFELTASLLSKAYTQFASELANELLDFVIKKGVKVALVKAYFSAPRITLTSFSNIVNKDAIVKSFKIDLLRNSIKSIAFPHQANQVLKFFNIYRGLHDPLVEDQIVDAAFQSGSNEYSLAKRYSINTIFQKASEQDIDIIKIDSQNIDILTTLVFHEEAKFRIQKSILQGNIVVVPSRNVDLSYGLPTIGFFELNPINGVIADTLENGGHLSAAEYTLYITLITGAIIYGLYKPCSTATSVSGCIKGILNKKRDQLSHFIFDSSLFKLADELGKAIGSGHGRRFTQRSLYIHHPSAFTSNISPLRTITNEILEVLPEPFFTFLSLPSILVGDISPLPNLTNQIEILPEQFLTLTTERSELSSLHRLYIKNTGPAAATYRVTFPNQPAGFIVKSSLPEVTIPAGETGVVGIMLIPNAGLPAPGTQAPFQVTITDTATNQTQTTPTTTFTTPEVVGVTLDAAPTQTATAPGTPVNATLTVKSVGNVAANNIPLTLQTSTGLSVSGLPATVSLAQGETKTLPLTLTASGALNDTLTATITASFGKDLDGNPYKANATVGVTLASATAQAAFCGVQPASEAARSNLAATLNNLGIALNQLEKEPSNATYRDRAVALLDSLIGQFNGPALTPLVADLTAARNALANAAPDALASLQNQLNRLCTTLTSNESALPFDLALFPASNVAQPGTPAQFYLQLRNNGDQAATYNLSLSALPAGVTGQLNQTSVTLAPGESTSVDQGQQLYATLTPSTQAIEAFEFTIAATLAGSSLSRSVQGILLARPESLRLANVKATPGFTEPGGSVQISTDVISAVNQTHTLQATYTVTDANSAVVFTSAPQTVTLTVTGTLTPLSLGTLITTGFARGSYRINVALSQADGTPLPGVTAQGSLLIGSPLAASLSLDPQVVPPGAATTQASLTLVGQNIVQNPQMQLLAQIDTKATARSLAVLGDYAYVCGTEDITLFDISDVRNPQIVTTLADDVINNFNVSICRIIDNHLIVNAQVGQSAGGLTTLIFDLADPVAPTLVSQTNLPYRFAKSWYSRERITFVPFVTITSRFGDPESQQGDFAAFDYSDFSNPHLISALYGFKGQDGGGPDPVDVAIPLGNRYALLGVGDSNGTVVSSKGRLLTIDTVDPAQMALVHETTVPGTKYIFQLILVGDILWVLGTDYEQTRLSFDYPDITLSAFNAADPLDLKFLKSIPIEGATSLRYDSSMASLGNGFIAIGGLKLNGQHVLTIVDVNDPLNPRYSALEVAASLGEIQRRENILFTPSDAGLGFYDIGEVLGLSYTAQVQIPNNTGVSMVADSFNIPPTRIDTGSDYDTLVWERALNNNRSQDILTWRMQATGLEPSEVRPVTRDTVIDFTTSTEDTGQVTLPPAELIARQILTLTPTSRTVKPGETASYTVTIENPSDQPITYTLSVQGVPNGWAQLASPVTIPAQSSQNVALNLVTTTASDTGQYGFVVTAVANTGFTAYLLGSLILQATGTGGGTPDLGPDITNPAQGVLITLTPPVGTAGLGTAATFTARIINLGDDTATFNLTGAFPAGFTSAFGETSVTLLPGLSNYRDVMLTLTPPVGTTPSDYPFTVTATDSSAPSVTDQAAGTVHVVNLGVDVSLTAGATAQAITTKATNPTQFTLRVTNTGLVRETYDLTLGGPLGLYATLAQNQVTLDPDAAQDILINVNAIDTALPGTLTLIGIATARSDTQVQDSDTISLGISATQGLHVAFDPDTQTLATPGSTSFLLRVQNTGNIETAYQAVITETNGPVSAALEGLDGQPTQRIATFRLPALATGLLTLDTALQQIGTGQVTVTVNALDTPALADADTATVRAQAQQPSDPTAIPTLNEWMKGLMALLMLLALMAVIRQRRYPR